MITLSRRNKSLNLTPLLWEASQVLAKQEGWKPRGAIELADRGRCTSYHPGSLVDREDAAAFADALVRVINGTQADDGQHDLGALAGMVGFLRGGAFTIL